MAAAVLGVTKDDIAARLKQGHWTEELEANIPIYVAYFTAWPNEAGTVNFYDDVYGRDKHLKKAMAAVATARRVGG